MNKIENNYYIDNIKFVLIFFVVFGHLIERYMEGNYILMGIYIFIYTFHMPLFIFISGLLSKNINKSRKFLLRKLLIPYIVLNIIWYSLAYLYTKETYIPVIYPGWTLWFLLSLFFWRISLKYLIKIKYILPISFILGIFIGLVPNGSMLSFSRTIVYLPFFLLGYYTNINTLNKLYNSINIWISILGISMFIALALFISENNIISYSFLYGSYSYLELGMNIFKGSVYRVILYLCSIILSTFILTVIPNKKTFYTSMGKSTMYVYVYHIYVILIIFYLIPAWNKNILTMWIILASPIFVTYILSKKVFARVYDKFFNSIFKLIK